ncbi:MAG: DMT family transporter [Actinomycetota bacterium]|nr:DMT family transporter [Actinomycetota bacterium]
MPLKTVPAKTAPRPSPNLTTPLNRTWLPLAAVAVTLLLWASAFVGIRHLAHTFSPGPLSLGRLVFGSLSLGVAVLVSRSWRRPSPRDWMSMAAIGVLWFGIYNVALNAGERRIDAGTAAMLIQISPILIAVLALFLLRERPTMFLAAGIALAFGGVALIAFSTSTGSNHDLLGVLLCVLSAVVYSISLILQKPLVSRLPALQVTWVACTVGAVACLPFAGTLARQTADASLADVGWLAYLGVFPTAIAFTTYAYALRHMSASNLGVTTYLVPPITVLLSWVFLAETPPGVAYVGGALCLVGVAVARRKPRAGETDAPVVEPPAASSVG